MCNSFGTPQQTQSKLAFDSVRFGQQVTKIFRQRVAESGLRLNESLRRRGIAEGRFAPLGDALDEHELTVPESARSCRDPGDGRPASYRRESAGSAGSAADKPTATQPSGIMTT